MAHFLKEVYDRKVVFLYAEQFRLLTFFDGVNINSQLKKKLLEIRKPRKHK